MQAVIDSGVQHTFFADIYMNDQNELLHLINWMSKIHLLKFCNFESAFLIANVVKYSLSIVKVISNESHGIQELWFIYGIKSKNQ